MRPDGHEITVAAPPNVVNLERGYPQLTGFDHCPGNGRARSTGHRNALLMIGI
ncbi:MAG: hypothetical protein ACREXU_02695 [Gammaproteobacteria bacterium]